MLSKDSPTAKSFKSSWFITFVLQILITFIFWLGSDFKMLHNLGVLLEGLLVIMVLIFWKILFRAKDYLEASYNSASNK